MSSSFFKKRLSPIKPGDPIDYKDVDLLKKFITSKPAIERRSERSSTDSFTWTSCFSQEMDTRIGSKPDSARS